MDETYYSVLGIPETATQDQIEQAFRKRSEAYGVLSNPTQHSSYDQRLADCRFARSIPKQHLLSRTDNREKGLIPILSRLPQPNWGFLAAIFFAGGIWYLLISYPH